MRNRKIFIKNIDTSVTYQELNDLFNYFGYVKGISILRRKGIAFVEMSHPNDAYRAILGLNNIELRGRKMKLVTALSDTGKHSNNKKKSKPKKNEPTNKNHFGDHLVDDYLP